MQNKLMEESSFLLFYKKFREIGSKNTIKHDSENVDLFLEFMVELSNCAYDRIHLLDDKHLKDKDVEAEIRTICSIVVKQIYPYFYDNFYMKISLENEDIKEKVAYIEDRLYRVMAFRSLRYFALYIERGNSKKIWRDTLDIFENFFYYGNRMVLTGEILQMRASYFPGAGKTYAGNVLCAFWFGYDWEMSILRATYSDELAKTFTSQIVNIIMSEEFRNVFPRFDSPSKDLWAVNNVGG